MARFLIDIDSTTMDTTQRQLVLANERFGSSYTLSHITEWGWENFMPPDVCQFVWGEEVFHSHSFHRHCPAVDRSVEVIRDLLDAAHTVYFVSDRPDHLYEVTREWLNGHGLEGASLIFTDRETYPKALAAEHFDLQWVVEDSPHHSVDLANSPQIKGVYLLDYAYNRIVPDHPKITRVSGWMEIENAVFERGDRVA